LITSSIVLLKVTKAALRKIYQNKRSEIPQEECEEFSFAIAYNFFDRISLASIKALHIYLPIRDNSEVNTWPIIDTLVEDYPEVKIIISKSSFATMEMDSYQLSSSTKLKVNKLGIPEPEEHEPFDEKFIDMVILPLLAYDKKGFRVGYGKGFYDRFLKKCRPDVFKVGVSFFEPVDSISDIDEFDIPLDCCITPETIHIFK
jgi:5-formyltetrahydrofolate cyclo-ligase